MQKSFYLHLNIYTAPIQPVCLTELYINNIYCRISMSIKVLMSPVELSVLN